MGERDRPSRLPERIPLCNVQREGRRWTSAEFEHWSNLAPEKVEFSGGIFLNDQARFNVLAMLLETLGIDTVVRFGKLEDWKAAIEQREKQEGQ